MLMLVIWTVDSSCTASLSERVAKPRCCFVPLDPALDGVPLPVEGRVERRRAPGGGHLLPSMLLLVMLDRNGRRDATLA
jgi:hypothetical protein